ncbi:bacillolysin [Nocardioides psychrotolerans]|uniref:Neutral metalloproteinase n=1 Tax=Nocardioides psychrotolerans TaxID=1005945 RepID=A0A1I3NMB4_9ACTN|nr:M4 family metallopeptidase [Nocardioides psychrotolerans]GEP39418.1 bacillolysin [Nocardioides psychrotolerans]SFJ09926.1 Zn-dependent metalloprotease [Nocardioides psychrotolerans]
MSFRSLFAISAATALAAATTVAATGSSSALPSPGEATSAISTPAGSFTLTDQKAADFVLPPHMTKMHTQTLPDGTTATRYQQMVRAATVFGGQITVIKGADGVTTAVIGAYFPDLQPSNTTKLTKAQALGQVKGAIGERGDFSAELRIDPRTDTYFYEVQSIRDTSRPVRWVDAATGETLKAFNALAEGEGIGVKGDRKTISTTKPATGDYRLQSQDNRQRTLDAFNTGQNGVPFRAATMTDADDVWDLPGNISPGQAAGVDAHYYAGVVDDFYADTFGRDSIDDNGMQIVSVTHFGQAYCNAFWNGAYMTYGDGNGTTCKSLAGGLDVDGHELTHGVTEYTSGLIYENASGALNESFSDIMGNTIEFYADKNGLDPAAEPDWLIGEDVINTPGDPTPGFRNMADPKQDGDPSHLSQAYTGEADNGGVHTNSGIPNHAYYLTINGGRNASCVANQYHGVLLTGPAAKDCSIVVDGLGVDKAAQVYYAGFTSLPEYANYCDARNATVAVAKATSKADGDTMGKTYKQVRAAWDAVGVHESCAGGTPPPPPCVGDASASLPFGTPNPYGNNGDCTWTYDNSTAGFRLHFSQLSTEADYDYVYVRDAAGTILATYHGDATVAGPMTSPCITTSTGSVQFTSDAAVTAPGFTVDAVEPC